MNILFLTLGTSEIQINPEPGDGFSIISERQLKKDGLPEINLKPNRSYSDFLLKSPRLDGENIIKNYAEFSSVIKVPLIFPVLEHLIKEEASLNEIWFFYTDQKDAEDTFRLNDTLYFKDIISLKIKEKLPQIQFHDYKIGEKVRDIDYQYKQLGIEMLKLSARKDEIEKVYLLPQGGIDQINQALALQLIQLFKDKVILYQNAERSTPQKLAFTKIFLNDLTKQNVIKHIRDFDFGKAEDLILDNEQLKNLAHYAGRRLNLLHEKIDDSRIEQSYQLGWKGLSMAQQKKMKLQDLIYSFKILIKQQNYNEALTKLFAVTDNLFKIPLSDHSNDLVSEYYDRACEVPGVRNERWENFIEDKLGEGYVNRLKKKEKHINNPNFLAESSLYRFLIEDKKISFEGSVDDIKKLTSVINDLRNLRNEIVHNLGAASLEDINQVLKKNKIDMTNFLGMFDKIMGTTGLGIYKDIQKKILANYGERL